MKQQNLKSIGLWLCVGLMTCPLPFHFGNQALAQLSAPGDIAAALENGRGSLGQTATELLQSGVTPEDLSQVLSQMGEARVNGADLEQILQTISKNSGMSPEAASAIINNLLNNQLSAGAAQALSEIPGLGSLSSASELTSALSSRDFQTVFSGLTASEQSDVLDSLLTAGSGGTLSEQLGSAGTAAVARAIAAASPELASALGGATGIEALINSTDFTSFGASLAALDAGNVSVGGNVPIESRGGGGGGVCTSCRSHVPAIRGHHKTIRQNVNDEFEKHRQWIITTYWLDNILPAMMLMAEQLTAIGVQQVNVIGTFLDAKHQLETQRLFEQMTAQAHKDYQPSEGMCTFGTTVRSLASSERKSDLAQLTASGRMMQRQTLSGDVISLEGENSDIRSRLLQFTKAYCDRSNNANALSALCKGVATTPHRTNLDIDYTRNIESRLTLDTDFTVSGEATGDEQDVFALAANLYAHKIPPRVPPGYLADKDGKIRQGDVEKYMDLRSVLAKRSVAQNSFAALTGMRAAGSPESAPYTKALMQELGLTNPAEIDLILGKNPSYFAQMEVLTKKLYQNPVFYTELYDKPVNVERKGAALQAIGLMQDRDLYNSLLRSEAVLSVLLETMLIPEQEKAVSALGNLKSGGGK